MDEENQSQQQTQTEQSPEKGKSMNMMVIGAILVVILVALGLFFVSKNNSPSLESSSSQVPIQVVTPAQTTTESESMVKEDTTMKDESPISVEAGGFYFKPNDIKVKKGQKVTIEFKNAGGMHDFVIDGLNVKSKLTNTGETATVEFTPTKTGEFEFYCSVADHRQKGMKGTLVVE